MNYLYFSGQSNEPRSSLLLIDDNTKRAVVISTFIAAICCSSATQSSRVSGCVYTFASPVCALTTSPTGQLIEPTKIVKTLVAPK